MSISELLKYLIDLTAVLLLALGIKGLSKVSSARDANRLAAIAMSFAVIGIFVDSTGGSGIAINSWILSYALFLILLSSPNLIPKYTKKIRPILTDRGIEYK